LGDYRAPWIVVREGEDADQITKEMEVRGEIPPLESFPPGHVRVVIWRIVETRGAIGRGSHVVAIDRAEARIVGSVADSSNVIASNNYAGGWLISSKHFVRWPIVVGACCA